VEREAKGCWSVEVVGGAVEVAGVDGAGRGTRDEDGSPTERARWMRLDCRARRGSRRLVENAASLEKVVTAGGGGERG
jgi:hypothetical protein